MDAVRDFVKHPVVAATGKGSAIGAVFGAGFHLVAGPSAMVIGQPNLRMQMIARQAAKASGRLAAVFALYSATKSGLLYFDYLTHSAAFAGGAVAVSVPFALNPKRVEFLQAYVQEHLRGMPLARPLAISTAAVSGAAVFGAGSAFLDFLGWNWC